MPVLDGLLQLIDIKMNRKGVLESMLLNR